MQLSWSEQEVAMAAGCPTRRGVLLGISVAMCVAACSEQPSDFVNSIAEPRPDPAFLRLSKSLTGHDDLDAVTAARLSAAFAAIAPDVHAQFDALCRLRATDPQSLLDASATHGLKFAALAIVAAWYTGSLDRDSNTETVAYHDALMHRPVADAMLPPTYALGGPGWWTDPPPDVGLGRSAAVAALDDSARKP